MIVYCEKYNNPPKILENSCVTFGVFDSIHAGHMYEINNVVKEAKSKNTKSGVITFNIDPDELFKKNFLKIMTNEQRIEDLSKTGVDFVVVLEFNKELMNSDPQDFLQSFLGKNKPESIHVGEGFKFGKKQMGNCDLLVKWAKEEGVKTHIHKLLMKDGKIISSTAIRKKLKEKDENHKDKEI